MAGNFRDEIKAYYNAQSGINFAIALLKEDAEDPEDPDDLSDDLTEYWAMSCDMPPLPIDEGYMSICIVDENRKININNLNKKIDKDEKKEGKKEEKKKETKKETKEETKEETKGIFKRFLTSNIDEEDLSDDIINNILDWIDEDDESQTAEGAERYYYESLDPPYLCKNRGLDTISELRLIKGIIEEKIVEKIEDIPEEVTIIEPGLMKYLTVYPVNEVGKININTAPSEIIKALSDNIDDNIAGEVIEHRKETPFKKKTDFKELIGDIETYNRIQDMIDVKSYYYSVDSIGEVNGIRKHIVAVLKRDKDKIKIVYWKVV
jgi:general secretion pathway protein K